MALKLSCVGLAVISALTAVPALAEAEHGADNIERINVLGRSFNDYKPAPPQVPCAEILICLILHSQSL